MKKGLQRWIGAEIQAQRLRLSLSLKRFAQRIDVSEADAEAIERGMYELDVSFLFRIASVLRIPTSRLVRSAEMRGRRLSLKRRKIKRSTNKKHARNRKPSR